MTPELVPLGTFSLRLGDQHLIPAGPLGTRVVVDLAEGRFEGDRLKASLLGTAGGDWLTLDTNGVATLDVRLTLETDDGASILVTYRGRSDFSQGPGARPIYTSPLFETADDTYGWLNLVQAVAIGTLSGDDLVYEMYEVRVPGA